MAGVVARAPAQGKTCVAGTPDEALGETHIGAADQRLDRVPSHFFIFAPGTREAR
jgi:hypothetical protein